MTLCEELYFEITLTGAKSELRKLVNFLRSGEMDDFFAFDNHYIVYDDGYDAAEPSAESSLTFTNDDCGIEIEEFDTDEFLEIFCRAAKQLEVIGTIYDINDDEFSFSSEKGDSYYINSRNVARFNEDDDLDEVD